MHVARLVLLTAVFVVLVFGKASAQTTAFNYQGSLKDGANAATGNYDFEFALFDALSGGTQLGSTLTRSTVAVANGTFAVSLDFGSQFPGANRFLEVRVRLAGGGAFTPLNPRSPVNSSPYSVKSQSADNAANAANATTASNAVQLGGLPANQYVTTSSGNSSYIQNTTSPQAASNFNISGAGTANIFNATTQYNIGGNRILSVGGTNNFFAGAAAGQNNTGADNTFVGKNAGASNTTGSSNSFFGRFAGSSNATGDNNSFFGVGAGQQNLEGFGNSFFGYRAGFSNDSSSNSFFGHFAGQANSSGFSNSFFGQGAGGSNTTGSNQAFYGVGAGGANTNGTANSFFGRSAGGANASGQSNAFFGHNAGDTNTTGSNNTAIGKDADVGSGGLNFATALGAGSTVPTDNTVVLGRSLDTVQIPGNLNVNGSFTGNVPSGSTNYIQNSATQQASSTFNISGSGTVGATLAGNIVNATTQYNLSGQRVLRVSAISNLFVGHQSGGITNGIQNSFFGFGTGQSNISGYDNTFVGMIAGSANTTGNSNSFFGSQAGASNSDGTQNSFVGLLAGTASTSSFGNSFFGSEAGVMNITGNENAFVGRQTGFSNTTGSSNSFFGNNAGQSNTIGTNNTIIGRFADVGSNSLINAAAIGANAIVSQSNSLVLGNGVKVGIGTTAPTFKLEVIDPSNTGLRVQTGTVGGTVASFGGAGAFNVDANGIIGGRLTVLENGNVGIGNPNPADRLNVNGNVSLLLGSGGTTQVCQNGLAQLATCSSSLRYKQNMNPFNSGLSLINSLRPITFDWKDGGMHDLGLGAEDVAAIEPLLVTYNSKGEVEGVKYDRIGVVLINAVKEQQEQISGQQNQIEEQRKQIETQQTAIDELKQIVCSLKPEAKGCVPR